MIAKRTLIGLIIGSAIIAIGGYSLITHIGTITINENSVFAIGEEVNYIIPAPAHTSQYMQISGDAFNLRLESPFPGLQIPDKTSENTIESFKDRIDEPLIIEWIHLADGETKINIQNTGNTELEITGVLIRSSDPIWFTYDLMVIISGMVIIGFSMGFTLRKPKGF